eukprot:6267092-Pyramimonas_sp.AAC.1
MDVDGGQDEAGDDDGSGGSSSSTPSLHVPQSLATGFELPPTSRAARGLIVCWGHRILWTVRQSGSRSTMSSKSLHGEAGCDALEEPPKAVQRASRATEAPQVPGQEFELVHARLSTFHAAAVCPGGAFR